MSSSSKNESMKAWPREATEEIVIKIILFLVSPFLGFVISLRNMNSKSSYLIFFLFALVFGLSFTVPSGKVGNNMLDGSSYREEFENYKLVDFSEYIDGLKEYLTFQEGAKDYYFDTIAFYVSRFTDNYHVMFLLFALVFSFFSLKTFRFLTKSDNFKTSLVCFILAYLFMSNHIFNINGVRFWTAAWVALYSIFQIFVKRKNKYILLAAITPFIHASYWLFLAIMILGLFLKRFHKFWIILFFVSFFFSTVAVDVVRSFTDILPPFIARMAESYTDQQYIEERNASGTGLSWLAATSSFLVKLFINLMVYLFIKNSKQISNNTNTTSLFSFLLILMTFVNFTMPIPSLGGRFIFLAYPLIAYIWLENFQGNKYKKIIYALPVIFSFVIISQIRLYKMVLDIEFFLTSPIYLIHKYLIV